MTQEINTDTDKITAAMMRKIVGHMRRPGESADKVCKACKKTKPIEEFYLLRRPNLVRGGYYETRASRCRECEKKRMRAYYKAVNTQPENHREEEQKVVPTCRDNCVNYPCFRGIDTMKSNLALTCANFKEK